ncbi:MAG: protein-export chaperone SecB [Gammaproteobacteria bacterium]
MADEQDNNQQTAADAAATPGAAQAPQSAQFALQRIYLKDSSFESPHSPAMFQHKWQPKVNFDLKTQSKKIQDDVYEVVLVLTAEAKVDDQPAFLVEVHQGGIFSCRDFGEKELEQILATVCPTILFPYAREVIDSLVTKGSYPALMLAPLNFDALYTQQKMAEQQRNQQAESAAAPGNGNGADGGESSTPQTNQ